MFGQSKQPYPSLRIFNNPVLESLTHVHPITPLLVWTPIISGLIYYSVVEQSLGFAALSMWAILALVVWTLTEYLLHRFLFHFPAKSKTGKYLVFLFHGLHHEDPNDPTRLVFPPVPAFFIFLALYGLFSIFIPESGINAFMGFFMVGYLCYDYIHYATHHFSMKGKLARKIKKHHLQHHFQHKPAKYGVSSPFWDVVFGSVKSPKEKK
jgi:sterol desaturase/sphingolipid hydroxylase (fatty acid hydroxylase superfamily)